MSKALVENGYSLSNAEKFGWAGFTSTPLLPGRLNFLERHILGKTVLDAGCGSGAFADHFARHGYNMTGIDNHDFCLAAATNQGYSGRFLQADITKQLPFDDKFFDTTYCCDVLEHVDDYAAIKELCRVTRRRIIFTVPQDAGVLTQFRLLPSPYQDPTHLRYYTKESVLTLATSVGPVSVTVEGEQLVDIPALMWKYLKPHSQYKGIGLLYNLASKYLLRRTPDPALCINWICVINLTASDHSSGIV